jgi:hypothetical protein
MSYYHPSLGRNRACSSEPRVSSSRFMLAKESRVRQKTKVRQHTRGEQIHADLCGKFDDDDIHFLLRGAEELLFREGLRRRSLFKGGRRFTLERSTRKICTPSDATHTRRGEITCNLKDTRDSEPTPEPSLAGAVPAQATSPRHGSQKRKNDLQLEENEYKVPPKKKRGARPEVHFA